MELKKKLVSKSPVRERLKVAIKNIRTAYLRTSGWEIPLQYKLRSFEVTCTNNKRRFVTTVFLSEAAVTEMCRFDIQYLQHEAIL